MILLGPLSVQMMPLRLESWMISRSWSQLLPNQGCGWAGVVQGFCRNHGQIRRLTAACGTFSDWGATIEEKGAQSWSRQTVWPGKGVVVAETVERWSRSWEAWTTGDSGARVVIEEFWRGRVLSCLVNGDKFYIMPTAQDHKRLRWW